MLERFLGNMRLKFKHSSYDALEFIKSLRSIALQNDILTKHPEWMKNAKHIMKRLALDYSSIASWKEDDQKLRGVNIVACWNLGRTKVETIILDSKYSSFDFLQEFSADVTMLCPMRSGVDVGVSNINFEIDEPGITEICSGSTQLLGVPDSNETASSPDGGPENLIDGSESIADRISEKFDPQFEYENKQVYKATALKALFSNDKVIADRLRRVQGLSRYPDENGGSIINEIVDSIMPGDPVIIQRDTATTIGIITKIHIQGTILHVLNLNDLSSAEIIYKTVSLTDSADGSCYTFDTSMIETTQKEEISTGKYMFPISPDTVNVNGKILYSVEKSLLHDIGITIIASNLDNGGNSSRQLAQDDTVKCKICSCKVKMEGMRKHVASHIIKKSLNHQTGTCGYCGEECVCKLVQTSKKKGQSFFRVESNCQFMLAGKNQAKRSRRNPCTNTLLKCSECTSDIWKYNMSLHFEANHPDCQIPNKFQISDAESKEMKLR